MSSAAPSGWPALPVCDLHVHARPSVTPRWGSDLDLVESAGRHAVRVVVLKSHHEQTASRALIATEWAQRSGLDCRVIGSVVLNPWISLTELDRALQLGARVVWWPTLEESGKMTDLDLPALHDEALARIAAHPGVVVGTGHLKAELAIRLAREGREAGLRVIATHPLNPDFGVGVEAGRALIAEGAIAEVDACSLATLRAARLDPVERVKALLADGPHAFASSDGGAAVYGEPFEFMRRELRHLAEAGASEEVEVLVNTANAWTTVFAPEPARADADKGDPS